LPNNIFYFNSFVRELFSRDAAGAYELLENYAGHLDKISFKENRTPDLFNALFDVGSAVAKKPDVQDMASVENEDKIHIDE
jgi:hypothetical protein